MKSFYISIITVSLLATSCSSSKSSATPEEIKALETLINNRDFKIQSNWALPRNTMALQQVFNSGFILPGNTPGSISLVGNYNFLSISGDSITSYLPYFGERQMHVAYNGGDSTIQFDGLLEDYNVKKNKNNSYTISFQSESKSEDFNCSLVLFPNLKSEIILWGSSRFPISYLGHIVKKED